MDNTDRELGEVQKWAEGLEMVHTRISRRFGRREPRQRALSYLKGLLSPIERKNGWQLAEHAGEQSMQETRHLMDCRDC